MRSVVVGFSLAYKRVHSRLKPTTTLLSDTILLRKKLFSKVASLNML